jgi:hypothetical protein
MDAERLEADSAPPSTGEESAAPDDAQNPQGSPLKAREGSTKARRAGQGGFRTYPRAQDRQASPAQASDDMGRQI